MTKKPATKSKPASVKPIVTAVNEATFTSRVIDAKGPVLVDFGAAWCGPCKMMAPVLDAIAAAHPKLTVYTLDIDKHPDVADAWKITSIPALRLFVGGRVVWKQTGAMSQTRVEAGITKYLEEEA